MSDYSNAPRRTGRTVPMHQPSEAVKAALRARSERSMNIARLLGDAQRRRFQDRHDSELDADVFDALAREFANR